MAELGSGNGSGYPASLDTDTSKEVNQPNASKTKARAEVVNDLAAAIIAIQTELGVDPAGTLTDLKTFVQTEHNSNGTHKNTLVVMLAGSQTITGQKTFTTDPVFNDAGILARYISVFDTAAKMTSGTVPLARLVAEASNGYPQSGTGGETALRTIRGTVNADGTIAEGTGFTITDNGTGDHTVNFTTAFSDVPSVGLSVVKTASGSAHYGTHESLAVGSVRIKTFLHLSSSSASDMEFSFIAVGPA